VTPDPHQAPTSSLGRLLEFLRLEAIGGLMLAAAAAVGLIWANAPGADLYQRMLSLPVSLRVGDAGLAKPLLLWVNDGLMAIFFLLVGLEIKREVIDGELSTRDRLALPVLAAVGGMAAPALIYVSINFSDPAAIRGWAIPAATDIAFALGLAALLGGKAPASLKILLSAVAIIDDLGAIVIIALFYTSELSIISLGLAGVGLAALVALNRAGIMRLAPYMLVGIFLWVCVLKSGVHATLAGVALAFAIPIGDEHSGVRPLYQLEHALHGWVAYAILPIFALANAGVSLTGMTLATLMKPIPLGIIAGLVLGKPIGVMSAGFVGVRLGIAELPAGLGWPQFFGMALLTGIGFTMSLFIGSLAFEEVAQQTNIRLGVLIGSLVAGLAGYLALALAATRAPAQGSP
jgi:Na+:H+ antiporter, NhaA family